MVITHSRIQIERQIPECDLRINETPDEEDELDIEVY